MYICVARGVSSPRRRVSAAAALAHPWLDGLADERGELDLLQEMLQFERVRALGGG